MITTGLSASGLVLSFAVVMLHSSGHDVQRQLLMAVNDRDAPAEKRIDAERRLRSSGDVTFLGTVLANLGEPIQNEFGRTVSMPEAYVGYPSTGIPEIDAKVLPVSAQIAYARLRIWDSYAKQGQPEEARRRILAELFDVESSDFQVRQLIRAARANWSEGIRRHLLRLALDVDVNEQNRIQASYLLIDLHHMTPEFPSIRMELVDAAWSERGSVYSYRVGSRINERGDPRVGVLRIEAYERERMIAEARGQSVAAHHVETLDRYFGVSGGLSPTMRMLPTAQELEDARHLSQLRRRARETGDDTKYRQFAAERAAKQGAELELRIKRIDAWIAANRDRLEREAEEFARERQRKRE